LISKKNYIISYLFLAILIFFTVILFVNYFISNAQAAFIVIMVLAFFSIVSFFKFEASLLVLIFFMPLYHIVSQIFKTSSFLIIFSMFIGCLFGGVLYLAKQKKPLIDLEEEISIPVIIFIIFMTMSFLFVYLRIFNHFSFDTHVVSNYALNVNLKNSSKAFDMAIYQYLNYFCGFLFLFLISKIDMTRKFIGRIFYTLFSANTVVFLWLFYQIFTNLYSMEQLNATSNQGFIMAHRYGSTLIDPNALGIYSIIILLSFIGFSYYFETRSKRIISAIVILESLVLLMFSGSRSGFMGLLLIVLFYLFMSIQFIIKKIYKKRKLQIINNKRLFLISIISFLIIIILFSTVFIFILKSLDDDFLPSTLKRLKADIYLLSKGNIKEAIGNILGGRESLWKAASYIVKDYPITGVGIGMITIELPNYGKIYRIDSLPDDMADNYYLQVAAELGIFALIVNLWIFWVFIKSYKIVITIIEDKRLKYLISNAFLILPIMLVMFIFGPHTYFMVVTFLFYFFMAFIVNFSNRYVKNINLQDKSS